MDKNNSGFAGKIGHMDQLLNNLSTGGTAPRRYFYLLVAVFIASTTITAIVARNLGVIRIADSFAPISSFAGVFVYPILESG